MRAKDDDSILTRRRILHGAGGLIAAAAFPVQESTAAAGPRQAPPTSSPEANITGRLARYMVEARDRSLPPAVAREGKHRILDTLAAMVSGARLVPGEMAIRYVRAKAAFPKLLF